MIRFVPWKKFFVDAASFSMRFAHGGLLAVGIVATVLFVGKIGSISFNLEDDVQIAEVINISASMPIAEARAASEVGIVPVVHKTATVLSSEMRGVVDYLSHKYRVASFAIEPLVKAAQLAGHKVGLDPLLIVSVMAIESGLNPIAESPMGAQGLMQIMPRYHQDKLEHVNQQAKAPSRSLLDPFVNIHVGALVLKESIRRAGSLQAGLAQYGGVVTSENQYAERVLAEKKRIELAVLRAKHQGNQQKS